MFRFPLLLFSGILLPCSFLFSQYPVINIGTTWTYELVQPIAHTTFKTYEVIEKTTWQDSTAYVIEDGDTGSLDYMHVAARKVYFWNQQAERYELHFDYAATEDYSAQWMGVCHQEDGIATANVDSLTALELSGDIITVQHLSIADNGSFVHDMPAKIYTGIGNDESLKLQLGYGLCDLNSRTTRLRCFTNGEVAYNFVGYPCDTTFVISSVSESLAANITLYPNPSTGDVVIEGVPGQNPSYSLYSTTGQLIQKGMLRNNQLTIRQPGVYVLVLTIGDRQWREKVVVERR